MFTKGQKDSWAQDNVSWILQQLIWLNYQCIIKHLKRKIQLSVVKHFIFIQSHSSPEHIVSDFILCCATLKRLVAFLFLKKKNGFTTLCFCNLKVILKTFVCRKITCSKWNIYRACRKKKISFAEKHYNDYELIISNNI